MNMDLPRHSIRNAMNMPQPIETNRNHHPLMP